MLHFSFFTRILCYMIMILFLSIFCICSGFGFFFFKRSNYSPFYSRCLWLVETEQEIFEQVLHGDLDFTSDPWPSISGSAKDLVRKMLVRDPRRRLTAHEVLCEAFLSITIISICQLFSCLQIEQAESVNTWRGYYCDAAVIYVN